MLLLETAGLDSLNAAQTCSAGSNSLEQILTFLFDKLTNCKIWISYRIVIVSKLKSGIDPSQVALWPAGVKM